ncbi:MAG TPA: hypothetical protein VFY71_03690 [Planctomycetota bacterium]|nr:hypothetical protein [Planctomycetota bacterium]
MPGDKRVRPLIENGLLWLGHHQDADGGWRAKSVVTHCDAGAPCDVEGEAKGDLFDTGLTGLAILALLGTGTTPSAPVVIHGATGDSSLDTWECATRAVNWLISQQDANGSVSDMQQMYDDCITATALCEASRIGKNAAWKQAAKRTVDFVVAGQASSPGGEALWGWRYVPRATDADTSVTGWAVQSLDAAERAGLHVPSKARPGAEAFIKWITASRGGVVGYLDPAGAGIKVTGKHDEFDYHVGTMTALGIQVRLRTEVRPDKASAEWLKSAVNEVLLKDVPSAKTALGVDYYYWHQAAEAWTLLGDHGFRQLAQAGKAWRSALVEALAALQSASSETCSSGGWLQGDRWSHAGGPVYCTAINLLTLEDLAGD